jgi:hypothetical protein
VKDALRNANAGKATTLKLPATGEQILGVLEMCGAVTAART